MSRLIIAFAGALIILRPGFREISPGHLAMIGTAILFAGSYLIAKRLTDSVAPSVILTMLAIGSTIGLAPFAIAVWQTPTLAEIGWLTLVAVFATAGHYTMTLAFAAAPVSVTRALPRTATPRTRASISPRKLPLPKVCRPSP